MTLQCIVWLNGWHLGWISEYTEQEYKHYLLLGTCATTGIVCPIILFAVLEGKWKYGDDSKKRNKSCCKPGRLLHEVRHEKHYLVY